MLIIDKIETIVYTPPKSGSTSANFRWSAGDVGAFWAYGPQGGRDGPFGKHSYIEIEYEYRLYKYVALIRDPYARALSFRKHASYHRNCILSMDDNIDELLAGNNWFTAPYSESLPLDRIAELWPIGMIDSIAEHYGLPKLPRLNNGNDYLKTGMDEVFTPEQVERLEPWVAADRELHANAIAYWENKLG